MSDFFVVSDQLNGQPAVNDTPGQSDLTQMGRLDTNGTTTSSLTSCTLIENTNSGGRSTDAGSIEAYGGAVSIKNCIVATNSATNFIVRNGGAAGALYVINFGVFLLSLAWYAAIAPGSGGAGAMMWIAFGIGQVYVLVRLWVKLVFWASATALFQSRFAHAGYVAPPEPTWPDSPAAEAI